MATPMTPDQFLAALRKWKVQVREYPGWRTRRRPQAWGPVYGLMIHHTGSDSGQSASYDDFLFRIGRDDLPAPLCNVATDMDGDLHLGAYGRANHAGAGSQSVLAHVLAEDYPGYARELEPGPDGPIGNQYFYGNEVKYDGGQPMTAAQYRTAVLTAAAICDHHGWSALSVIGHREWTRRKPDPGHCDMAAFRLAVKTQLNAGPPGAPTPPEEDMPLTKADAKLVVDDLLAREVPVGEGKKTILSCLSEASSANDAFAAIKNLAAKPAVDVNALAAAIVAKIPGGQPVDQATVEAGVRAVLGKLDEP